MPLDADFFDAIRPLYGTLSPTQVDGINRVAVDGWVRCLPVEWVAYALATVHHETGARMQPVREGFAKSDEQAMRAVASLLHRGIITRNYAERDPVTGESYYGRGPVQITWKDNYQKFQDLLGIPLVKQPDLALDWQYACPILYEGMLQGLFRKGATFKRYLKPGRTEFQDYVKARNIINGDVNKNGAMIAEYAVAFEAALRKDVKWID